MPSEETKQSKKKDLFCSDLNAFCLLILTHKLKITINHTFSKFQEKELPDSHQK